MFLFPISSGGSVRLYYRLLCTNLRYILRHLGYTTRKGRRRCNISENHFISDRALLVSRLPALRINGGLQIIGVFKGRILGFSTFKDMKITAHR